MIPPIQGFGSVYDFSVSFCLEGKNLARFKTDDAITSVAKSRELDEHGSVLATQVKLEKDDEVTSESSEYVLVPNSGLTPSPTPPPQVTLTQELDEVNSNQLENEETISAATYEIIDAEDYVPPSSLLAPAPKIPKFPKRPTVADLFFKPPTPCITPDVSKEN